MERLLHLARRRAARLAVAALLGLPAPLVAQSPPPAELLPPRPMPSPAHPWDPPAVTAAPKGPIAPGGPAAALGTPVMSATEPARPPHVWRGVMDGVDAPTRPGSLPSPSSGTGSVMWVVKPNGAVVPAPGGAPLGAATTIPTVERPGAKPAMLLPVRHGRALPALGEACLAPGGLAGHPPFRWYGYGTFTTPPAGYAPAGGNVVPGTTSSSKMPKTTQHWQPARPGSPTSSASIPSWPSNADVLESLRPGKPEVYAAPAPSIVPMPTRPTRPIAATAAMTPAARPVGRETLVIGPPPPPMPPSARQLFHLPEGRTIARPLPSGPSPLPRYSQPLLPPVPPPLPGPAPTTPVVPHAAMSPHPVTTAPPTMPTRPALPVTMTSATMPMTHVPHTRTLQEIVEQSNAGLGRDVQVLRRTDGNLVIRFKVRQAADAETLANRLAALPELARFKVDFEAQVAP